MTRSVRTLISPACVIVGLLAVFVWGDGDPAHISEVETPGLLCIAVAFAGVHAGPTGRPLTHVGYRAPSRVFMLGFGPPSRVFGAS